MSASLGKDEGSKMTGEWVGQGFPEEESSLKNRSLETEFRDVKFGRV